MPSPESIGALLARIRLTRGWSQLRLAELLCAASGLSTITRHEVSRWEREERVPGTHWLRWLAVVLEVPPHELASAAAASRARRAFRPLDRLPGTSGSGPSVEPLDPGGSDLARLARTWLAAPADLGPAGPACPHESAPTLDALATRLHDLRRVDDLVGGADLADPVDRELGRALALLPGARRTRPLLRLVAELAQLAGWTAADAGRTRAALRAYRTGLAAAEAAGDRTLGGHLLGCLSHLVALTDPHEALLVARTAYAGARNAGPAGLRALLLHRIAFAAALARERRASEEALAAAERLADRRSVDREPGWLYWLDESELLALTGRCLAALRRPLRAEPLLRRRLDRHGAEPGGQGPPGQGAGGRGHGGPRTAALDGGWLAEAYLDAGEVEQACAAAGAALVAALRSGSPRATARALAPRTRLARAHAGSATRAYAELVAAARPYLPGPGAAGSAQLASG